MTRAHRLSLVAAPLAVALAAAWFTPASQAADDARKPAAPKPALSVTLVQASRTPLPFTLDANGSIAAWQEASVSGESNGLRLARILVAVGDPVQRGQLLAQFATDTLEAELAQAQAAAAEADAAAAEAGANAGRAREVKGSGALSEQQVGQYLTGERTAQARAAAAHAALQSARLRLAHAEVRAPDAGVVSARNATLGAVMPAGQEMFRIIRQNRLEWRAEVPAAELARLKPGLAVSVTLAGGGAPIEGRVRMLAPTVDAQTRNAIVYVDLPKPGAARAGMFAQGRFALGDGAGLTLPQGAVLQRDGYAYVMRVGADGKVAETKVGLGRRSGERIEITGGLAPDARVVATGVGFLADGDTVRVIAPAK